MEAIIGATDFFLSRLGGTSMKLPARREMEDFISPYRSPLRFFQLRFLASMKLSSSFLFIFSRCFLATDSRQ